jgi:hypothetical protein
MPGIEKERPMGQVERSFDDGFTSCSMGDFRGTDPFELTRAVAASHLSRLHALGFMNNGWTLSIVDVASLASDLTI